jgi:hypothetical protein
VPKDEDEFSNFNSHETPANVAVYDTGNPVQDIFPLQIVLPMKSESADSHQEMSDENFYDLTNRTGEMSSFESSHVQTFGPMFANQGGRKTEKTCQVIIKIT